MLRKGTNYIYYHYFAITIISAFLAILTDHYWLTTVIFPLFAYLHAYNSTIKKYRVYFSFSFADVIFILIWVSIVLSWMINTYTNKGKYIILFLLSNGAFMCSYIVGRFRPREETYKIFEKAIIPLLCVNLLGVFLYFYNPAWYEGISENNPYFSGLEARRMRSIFSSPYDCSYMSFFITSFILLIKEEKIVKIRTKYKIGKGSLILCFGSCLLALGLCMQRAPIGGFLMGVSLSVLFFTLKTGNLSRMIIFIFAFIILFVLVLFVLPTFSNFEGANYFIEKFQILFDADNNFVEYRYDLFDIEESWFGDGAGRHSHFVLSDHGYAITDSEYNKLLQEVGYVGQGLYLTMLIFVLVKCVYYWRYLGFELCVILFLMISMIGADPLSLINLQPILSWLVIGTVVSFSKVTKFKNAS